MYTEECLAVSDTQFRLVGMVFLEEYFHFDYFDYNALFKKYIYSSILWEIINSVKWEFYLIFLPFFLEIK